MRIDLAGRDVTHYLRLLLRKEGVDLHRSAEFEIVREMKERVCYLSASVCNWSANRLWRFSHIYVCKLHNATPPVAHIH